MIKLVGGAPHGWGVQVPNPEDGDVKTFHQVDISRISEPLTELATVLREGGFKRTATAIEAILDGAFTAEEIKAKIEAEL